MEEKKRALLGAKRSTLDLDGTQLSVSAFDAQALKRALLEFLTQAAPSDVEDRDYLLSMTQHATSEMDSEGMLRIGVWLLQVRRGRLVLIYRLPLTGAVTRAYVATVQRSSNSWRVLSLRTESIHARRRLCVTGCSRGSERPCEELSIQEGLREAKLTTRKVK